MPHYDAISWLVDEKSFQKAYGGDIGIWGASILNA